MRAALGLQAAWLLARGRPTGLALISPAKGEESAEAARSFWAVALCLPAFVALRAIDWAGAGMPAQAGEMFGRDLLALVIGWVGFLVLMDVVCARAGIQARWPRFVVAWNWCSLLQAFMAVAAALPGLFGAPDWISQTAGLVVGGWSLWLGWFATRLTLGLSGAMAAAVVALDVAIELLVSGMVSG